MEFNEVIKSRYSCKKYDPARVISEQQLEEILQAGRLAPTAKNQQVQRIYVAQSPEALAAIDKHTPCRYGATTVLVVAWDKKDVFVYPGSTRDSGAEDASIVATHMMLAAANAGVDSCWVNFFNPAELAAELSLPGDEEILMLLDLGFAAEGAEALPNHFTRKEITETVKKL